MRIAIFFGVLSFSAVLAAQSPAANEETAASGSLTVASGPGTYALPFVPQVSTPSIELARPALRTGASNSTGLNVVGAQTSTITGLPQQNQSPLITPQVAGAEISEDIYPRNENSDSQ